MVAEPLKKQLDRLAVRYQDPELIQWDPIAIPHAFDDDLDREIIGLFSALLAWGRRTTVLNKMNELCERVDFKPAQFVSRFDWNASAVALDGFKHRTFSTSDAIWLFNNLSLLLKRHDSIEGCFRHHSGSTDRLENAIEGFSSELLSVDPDTPARLKKHVARPSTGSACKRLCMYVRWMVRPGPFDLGVWTSFDTSELILPIDVHSGSQARRLGLLERNANDWQAALELTEVCRTMDPVDPCKYDLALFGAGVYGGLEDFYIDATNV